MWAGRITFPAWNSRGRYRLDVSAEDGAGNFVFLGGGWSYSDAPIPGPDSIVVSGGLRDRRHPVVRIIKSPTSPIDLRSSDQITTVRARIRDAKSGVQDAVLHGDHGLKMPLRRMSGTKYDGVWEARAVLSHCIKLRRTSLNITAHDAAGHSGFASHSVRTFVSDHKSPYWKVFTGSLTGPLRWEWTEDVVGISNESAAVGHFENHVRIPVPGSWSCLQADGSPVDCVAGPVRVSIYTPTITLARKRGYEATFNPPGILAVTDLAGNPAHRFNWSFPRA